MTKKCTKCGVLKRLDDFREMRASADGKRPSCRECSKLAAREYRDKYKYRVKQQHGNWYKKYKDRIIEQHREYRSRNEEQVFQLQKKYRANNAAKRKLANDAWRTSNPERHLENAKKWSKNNRPRVSVTNAKRRGQSRLATPVWANEFFMAEAYDLARRRTKATGFRWHVDHMVPLRSKLVCGLHCEQNMRVIPAVLNLKKRNLVWPDMPCA